jgi:ribokinase
VLNAAPALPLPDELLGLCDVLVVNEAEAEALCGVAPVDEAACVEAAAAVRRRRYAVVVITLGAGGVFAAAGRRLFRLDAHDVTAVDTTAAGDAFCGAFAAALASGAPFDVALRWGNAAGGLAVGKMGAAPSLPERSAVEALLRAQPIDVQSVRVGN